MISLGLNDAGTGQDRNLSQQWIVLKTVWSLIFYFMKFSQKKKPQKFMKLSFLKHLKINFQIDYLMEYFKLLEYKLLWSFQAP